MLLPSILRMLDQIEHQWNVAEAKTRVPLAKPDEGTGLQRIELEIAAAAELVKPSSATTQPSGTPSTGPFLEELLRAITKFEKSEESRVVDVFE
jgi:hypothetical protein